MENSESVLITYTKNLVKQNFNTNLTVPIDNNVNIKTILNIDSYLFDVAVECSSGKAIMTGKVGVKVLYLDVDNITNTITDTTSFSQTFFDDSITADCKLNVYDHTLINTIVSSENVLKINVEISVCPMLYMNLALPTKNNFENMIVKKTEIDTSTISNVLDTSFEYTTNMQTKDNVTKILNYSSSFTAENVTTGENVLTVEGKLYSYLVYETTKDDNSEIKELKDCVNVKTDVPVDGLTSDCVLDLTFNMDRSRENISTEIEDGNCEINLTHTVKLYGVAIKFISLELIDDMYSTENEIELTHTSRDYNSKVEKYDLTETISGEVALTDSEPAIEEILCNLNAMPEITNTYLKDGTLYVEGIVTSHLTYLDENKTCQHKATELPFVINTKIELDNLDCVHTVVSILDGKVKARRGTILEVEYTLHFNFTIYSKLSCDIVDNLTIGKAVDFSEYDYQIYLAKPSETMWDLCKRIKVTLDDILKLNKNLPEVLEGGEKIVIKR